LVDGVKKASSQKKREKRKERKEKRSQKPMSEREKILLNLKLF
jgi:hypothetical protein